MPSTPSPAPRLLTELHAQRKIAKEKTRFFFIFWLGVFLITLDAARSGWQKTVRVWVFTPSWGHTQGPAPWAHTTTGNFAGSTHFPICHFQQAGPSPWRAQPTLPQPHLKSPLGRRGRKVRSQPLRFSEPLLEHPPLGAGKGVTFREAPETQK